MARMWFFDGSLTEAASAAPVLETGREPVVETDRDVVSFEDRLVQARTRRSTRPERPEAHPAAELPPAPHEAALAPPVNPRLPAAGHRGFSVPPSRPVRRGAHPGWALAAGLLLGAGAVLGGFGLKTEPVARIPTAIPVAGVPAATAPRPMTAAPVRAATPLLFEAAWMPRFETGSDPRRIAAPAEAVAPEPDVLGRVAAGLVLPVVSAETPGGGALPLTAPVHLPQAPVAARTPGVPAVLAGPAGEPEGAFATMRRTAEAPAPAPVVETPLAPKPAVRSTSARALSAPAPAAPAFTAGPRVYVHVPPGSSAAGLRAIAALGRAGYGNVVTVPVPFAVSRSNIRYYHASDRGDADRLQDAVAGVLPGPGHPAARDFTSFDPLPRAGTLEVWIAGG